MNGFTKPRIYLFLIWKSSQILWLSRYQIFWANSKKKKFRFQNKEKVFLHLGTLSYKKQKREQIFRCLELITVKSWIESATLFKIRLFWWDSNRVRIVFEWGLYFFIYFKSSKKLTKLAMNSSKMMKNIANLIWFFYINIELTIYYVAKSCQISFFGQTKD